MGLASIALHHLCGRIPTELRSGSLPAGSPHLASSLPSLPSASRRAAFSTGRVVTTTSVSLLDGAHRYRGLRLWGIGCVPQIKQDADVQITEEGGGQEATTDWDEKNETMDKSFSSSQALGLSDIKVQGSHEDTASLARQVIFWISAAVVFGVGVGVKDGVDKASEFFAGYLLEKSLSVDNLFVFILIFKYFKVPTAYQGRVLSYGIAGAVIFRAIMISLGSATLERFEVVNVLLALILIYSAYKLFTVADEDEDLSNNFIVKTCQKYIPVAPYYDGDRFFTIQNGIRKATPLLLTVAVLELSDVAFAIDSIPAVFGVTRDPFIVFSSNIFAILGLRSLYRLISESMTELDYLQPAIGIVLGFIGSKMLLDFFGYHVSTEVSLGFVAIIIGSGLLLSLVKKSD